MRVEKFSCSYNQACPCIDVTNGIVMGAATVIVLAASGSLKWATSPGKAIPSPVIDAAAGIAFSTGIVVVTDCWRLHWRGRRWAGIWGVLAFLERIGGLHRNSTFATSRAGQITLQPDIAVLTPAWTPGVLHNPIVNTIICSIPNRSNTMIQCSPTGSGKYTLKI